MALRSPLNRPDAATRMSRVVWQGVAVRPLCLCRILWCVCHERIVALRFACCNAEGARQTSRKKSGGKPPHSKEVFVLIECALNGGRTRSEHPGVPCTPQELANSAREAVSAGAGAAHFHVRNREGHQSLEAEDVARAVEAVRAAIPGTPFGVSTGAWIVPDAKARHEKVAQWKVLPPLASVNFSEQGGVTLAELLLSRGVGIEAGVGSAQAVEAFVASGTANRCIRVMFEPEQQDLAGRA